jgi:polyhydroxybutyrate depolymerase
MTCYRVMFDRDEHASPGFSGSASAGICALRPAMFALCRLAPALLAAAVVLSACGSRRSASAADSEGDLQRIEHAGRSRSFIVRLPTLPPEGGERVPLVIVLHGGGGNGAGAESMTGFTLKARTEGFIVAYPEGTARGRNRFLTWNARHCCGYAMQNDIDDVGFLRTLIDHLAARYPVDRRRIYVTGMSNGAMMSHRAGMELPDRVAAIAPVVGGIFGDEAGIHPAVSAIMINGMQDRSVPYAGGAPGGPFARAWDGTPIRPALDQARYWASANQCGANPVTVETDVYVHVRFDCPRSLGVEIYSLKEGGHAWPGGQRGSVPGDVPSRSMNATDLIWGFFAAHPKQLPRPR